MFHRFRLIDQKNERLKRISVNVIEGTFERLLQPTDPKNVQKFKKNPTLITQLS